MHVISLNLHHSNVLESFSLLYGAGRHQPAFEVTIGGVWVVGDCNGEGETGRGATGMGRLGGGKEKGETGMGKRGGVEVLTRAGSAEGETKKGQ